MKKLTWNDLFNSTAKELKAKLKLNDRQLEKEVRGHLDGANASERQELYKTIWNKK
jgi:hypothetical protein